MEVVGLGCGPPETASKELTLLATAAAGAYTVLVAILMRRVCFLTDPSRSRVYSVTVEIPLASGPVVSRGGSVTATAVQSKP